MYLVSCVWYSDHHVHVLWLDCLEDDYHYVDQSVVDEAADRFGSPEVDAIELQGKRQ